MILIVSVYEYEGSTTDIIDWLIHKKANYLRLNGKDFYENEGIQLLIENDNDDISMKNKSEIINFSKINVVWLRRWFDYKKEMVNTDFLLGNEENKKLRKYILTEFKAFSEALLYFLSSRDIHWLTKPNTSSPNKIKSLLIAKSVGLKIPSTLITNSKKHLKEIENKFSIITKNLGEAKSIVKSGKRFSTYTNEVYKEFIDELGDSFFVSKIQEKIQKRYELRVFILGEDIYSMAIFSQLDNQTSIDFRKYNDISPNRNIPYKLPNNIEVKLLEFMKLMDLNTGSIDMIKNKNNEYIFLEVNPVGQFSMVSYPCNYYIEEKIASYLINKDKKNE